MRPLHFQSLAYPECKLVEWKRGHWEMLAGLPPSSFIRRILEEKVRNRKRIGRRFFGEAFVATNIAHEQGWYGSFKWLTSWPIRSGSYAGEYRAALSGTFPFVIDLPTKAFELSRLLEGKNPVPPDLWLVVNGEHRFIEVKMPGDVLRPTQVAGLALIATCLSRKNDVSVWVYNLYPDGGLPDEIPASIQAMYREFCEICGQPNKRLQPTRLVPGV